MSLGEESAVVSDVGILGRVVIPTIRAVTATVRGTTVTRGAAFVATLGASLMQRGQVIIAEATELVDEAGMVIGRFKLDLLSQRVTDAGNRIAIAVEGKGVPWFLSRGGEGWQKYLTQLGNQAQAYGQAAQSAGQAISQRVIVFSSRAPVGLEEHWNDIQKAIGTNYDKVFTTTRDFELWLDTL